jgi:uncharacterized protein YdeI (YjbR/CyaY-like superfamily)
VSESETRAGLPIVPFASVDAWERWLREHHAASGGVWIKLAKAGSGIASVTYAEALDVALCHGWIDGQKAPYDATYWLQRFTRRGPRSTWSKINRDKVAALIAQGRMAPAGQREIDAAVQDGRWEAAYDSARTMTVPDDLQARLDQEPRARDFFATLDRANRYAILYRVQTARKPEMRARRIEQLVAMLAEGRKIHERPSGGG